MAKLPPFEKSLQNLEEIVKELERGDLPLEECLKKFEKGMALVRQCQEQLATAEQKITILADE